MIYTFGCSHTYGVQHTRTDTTSWPEKLAELLPDHQVEDYSFPGTSLEYSIYQFNRLYSQRTLEDIFVFQATVPHRYTHWSDHSLNDHSLRTHKTPNYSKYTPAVGKLLHRYGPGTQPPVLDKGDNGALNPDDTYHKLRYLYHNNEQEFSNYYSLTNWLQSRTDLLFKWADYRDLLTDPDPTSHKPIQNIKDLLGTDRYHSYCGDESNHFNLQGSMWVAEWVHKQLKAGGKL